MYTLTQPAPFTLAFTLHHCELWGVGEKRKKREKRKCASPGLKETFLAWELGKRKWKDWCQPASVHGCLFKLAFLATKTRLTVSQGWPVLQELMEPARTRSLHKQPPEYPVPNTPRSCYPLSALANHGRGPGWPAPDDGTPVTEQKTWALFLEGVITLEKVSWAQRRLSYDSFSTFEPLRSQIRPGKTYDAIASWNQWLDFGS